MPNWCVNSVEICCENQEIAKMFEDKIYELTENPYVGNGFGRFWLGNIVGNGRLADNLEGFSGIDYISKAPFNCRGCIEDICVSDNNVLLNITSAWTPSISMWNLFCEKFFPKDEFYIWYSAVEPGCVIYVTNNMEDVGTYYVDTCDGVISENMDSAELIVLLQKNLLNENEEIRKEMEAEGKSFESLDDLIETFYDGTHPDADNIWISEWEYSDISNW